MTKINYMTKQGFEDLKKEIEQLKTKERPSISKQIAEARDKGDLSENAEYDAAKEAQGLLEAKIAKLETILASSRIMDTSKVDSSKVNILSTVKCMNLKIKKEVSFTIVSEKEANIKQNKISSSSPIGKSLLGKKVGNKVEVRVPAGIINFEILEISL
ncbi:MAG: transcription elongation factor GreA [Bacteroidetes bacterium MED-G17]|jgi:transcription elongation factor GreA|nr:MAG: transcription elongation factor GreA [Bacteroidetes bacterium MED-G17]|tara:strand:+ start:10753 stop:11226 length:474 start_codon:yes stop_codon:yes gene_type:complete